MVSEIVGLQAQMERYNCPAPTPVAALRRQPRWVPDHEAARCMYHHVSPGGRYLQRKVRPQPRRPEHVQQCVGRCSRRGCGETGWISLAARPPSARLYGAGSLPERFCKSSSGGGTKAEGRGESCCSSRSRRVGGGKAEGRGWGDPSGWNLDSPIAYGTSTYPLLL